MSVLLFLLPACVVSALACARLCRAVAATSAQGSPEELLPSPAGPDEGIGLFDAAYLAGGPERVVDLVLVRMALRGRLLLAHTGWTTVARPEPADELEEAAFAAIGPEGQCRTEELRQALAADPAVLEIAIRLAGAGLAVPSWVRERTSSAVRAVRHAMWLTVLCLLMALLTGSLGIGAGHSRPSAVASWFALPLILTTGTLLMARVDVYPYTRWAAPAGQELLRRLGGMRRSRRGRRDSLPGRRWTAGGRSESLAAVAVAGAAAIRDPLLRAALRPPRRWAAAADW
ncbi:TIGR04222 domain-containing membrane protein [Phaeacidiphilus oryzae]|uniref:TIGR04222 domain-containing membrane protein n=1 Tax=Phaeacidiphilus oryzae TaxID=348818 RepID=UPI00068B3EAE|nr:TIGR04222 domain-containing membrane protein [Phaeacidiphilus oryzae]